MSDENKIIDGKAVAAEMRDRISLEVEVLGRDHGIVPGLAVVLVGDDPASEIYVRSKGKMTRNMGMNSIEKRLPATATQNEVLDVVHSLNTAASVNGILVQLPMPGHIDESTIVHAIEPTKDVDGLHPDNVARLVNGKPGLVPCTPLGCVMLLERQLKDLTGAHVVVIGRSQLVGKPVAQLLLGKHCTVTMAHSRTRNLPALCRLADILIAAVGQPKMVKADWVKPGATVIDVGINRTTNADGKTRLVGDVDYDGVLGTVSAITPVPGGVGPMTIACLLHNTLTATRSQNGI
jgi:methylenetetrahydrofolate dehydrogenase (NADP+)/methenyltetrahydrofolate cyclohydrolase